MKILKVLICISILAVSANRDLIACEEFANRAWGTSISAGLLGIFDILTAPLSVKRYNKSLLTTTTYNNSYNIPNQKNIISMNKLNFSKAALMDRSDKNIIYYEAEPDKIKLKSPTTALLWSVGATVFPGIIGFPINSIYDVELGPFVGGTIGGVIGPSAGQWYAGRRIRVIMFTFLRAGLAGIAVYNYAEYINCID